MKYSILTGVAFGLTSGVITTLGLMVGLHAGTHSKIIILGGILTIAIADSLSDALGIHVAEEAKNTQTTKQIWVATISTFLTKFIFTLTFIIPVLLLPLQAAIITSLIWGVAVLTALSYFMAKSQQEKPWKIITEHLLIAAVVIAITHWVGNWIATFGV